jgi:hemerythrin
MHNIKIDEEHTQIFDLVNLLIDTDELHPRSERFAHLLSELTDYGMKHFKHEECLMVEWKYPFLEEHRRDHFDYIYRIALFNTNFKSHDYTEPEVVLQFVTRWWYNHILIKDMQFARYIKSYQ